MPPAAIFQATGSRFIVEKLHDELVVFDRRTNKVHLLNSRAALIYEVGRDGCSIDDLAGRMAGRTIEESRKMAELGVAELERIGLVVNTGRAVSRRGLLKTLGATAALPAIISIAAPTPAAAATVGAPCNVSPDCGSTALACSNCILGPPPSGICQLCIPNGTSTGPGICSMMNSCLCCSGMCDDGTDLCEP